MNPSIEAKLRDMTRLIEQQEAQSSALKGGDSDLDDIAAQLAALQELGVGKGDAVKPSVKKAPKPVEEEEESVDSILARLSSVEGAYAGTQLEGKSVSDLADDLDEESMATQLERMAKEMKFDRMQASLESQLQAVGENPLHERNAAAEENLSVDAIMASAQAIRAFAEQIQAQADSVADD